MTVAKGIFLPLLLVASACQTAPAGGRLNTSAVQDQASSEQSTQAAAMFDKMATQYPSLNATVRKNGRIVWEREGGVHRSSGDGVAMDYNFYSTAKMLTGLAFARLEQEKRLDLSKSVRAIDPSLPAHYAPVTLRHLLTHTGGVTHYRGDDDWKAFNARRCKTPADALPHFINDPLTAAPGEKLGYSSYGFVLLSHLLVKISGAQTYDDAMRKALGPAYTMQTDREGAQKATSYMRDESGFEQMPKLSAECKFGAGGLLASARDLAQFGDALYRGAIIDVGRASQLVAGETDGKPNPFVYGTVVRLENGVHVLGHSGGSPGGRSYLEVWLEPKVAVGITGNLEGPGLGELAANLARIFADAPKGVN